MSIETLISIEDYLNTAYHPDVEYVDGILVERNVGDWLHALVERNLVVALSVKYPHVYAVPEFRSQTTETRFRLPDVCVLLAAPTTRYLLDAAFLAIEILSEGDDMSRVTEKLDEYDQKGVPNIWLIDPRRRTMSTYGNGILRTIHSDVIATVEPRLEVTRSEVFSRLVCHGR